MSRAFWSLIAFGVVCALLLFAFITLGKKSKDSGEALLVYTSRQDHLVKPLFELYERETGTKVKWVSGDAPVLIERLKQEGQNSSVDLLLAVDAGNLWQASELGLFEPLDSDVLESRVPEHLQSKDDTWFGVSIRARTIVYDAGAVQPEELLGYEQLADPQWAGRLCLRTSKKVYNQSLVAMLIEHHGEARAEQIVRGWVNNLARPVFSSDTHLIEAIDRGECQVGLVNTYYLAKYQSDHPDTRVRIFWPGSDTFGVHVNVTGAGVLKSSGKKEKAKALVEWLAGDEAQKLLAHSNREFPVVSTVAADPLVSSWGEFLQDSAPLETAGKRQAQAIKLMDRAGYN